MGPAHRIRYMIGVGCPPAQESRGGGSPSPGGGRGHQGTAPAVRQVRRTKGWPQRRLWPDSKIRHLPLGITYTQHPTGGVAVLIAIRGRHDFTTQ